MADEIEQVEDNDQITDQDLVGDEEENNTDDTASVINNMIDNIIDGNNTEAGQDLQALLASKLSAALELKKQEIAQSLYNQENGSDEQEEPEEQDA